MLNVVMIARRHARVAGWPLVVAGCAVAVALATAVTASAVSGGGYSPERQGCSRTADRNDQPDTAQPGCHNATLQVSSGSWQAASLNLDQTPNGTNVHSGSVVIDDGQGQSHAVKFDTGEGGAATFASGLVSWLAGGASGAPPSPDGVGGVPVLTLQNSASSGGLDPNHPTASVYFGADDNLDTGEHDGVNPSAHHGHDRPVANGPSDGGALQANVHPQGSVAQPTSLVSNVSPTDMHRPVGAADATGAGCADGVCAGADTQRRKMYQGGCRSCADQAVYDDQNTTNWRSPDCNSGSTQNQNDCGSNWQSGNEQGDITQPYYERGAYYDDPGVFVYEDPDPQSSPVLPVYPLCELYVGTEGVYACSNQVVAQPVHGGGPAPLRSPLSGPAVTAPAVVTPVPLAPSTVGSARTLGLSRPAL
jgi:hypothetical protein